MSESVCLTVKDFELKYQNKTSLIKGGSLCFWGQWFGRPYENYLEIVSVSFDKFQNKLVIIFSKQEKLIIENPGNIEEHSNRLEIKSAERVYFEWYDYGKVQKLKNLMYYDFTKVGNKIKGKNNIHWSGINSEELTINKPAVLLT